MVAVDIGRRTTKVVYLLRQQGQLILKDYFSFDSPAYEGFPDENVLTDLFSEVRSRIPATTKCLVVTVSAAHGWLLHAELPQASPEVLRPLLKANSKRFLQHDLGNYLFECSPTSEKAGQGTISPKTDLSQANKKQARTANYLVSALKIHFVNDLKEAASKAGFKLSLINVGQVSTVNSCLKSIDPEQHPAVAILDIGFSHSTINIILNGEFILTRTVETGGDKFTSGLADMMSINYPAAEGIKLVMPDKVQAKLRVPVSEVGMELRASIDFFENQYDIHVSRILLVGGSARSDFIVSTLEEGLQVPCEKWVATDSLELKLEDEKAAVFEKEGPQLSTVLGAAKTWFDPTLISLNILAEEIEQEEARRKDPVRRAKLVSAGVFSMVALWLIIVVAQILLVQGRLAIMTRSLSNLQVESIEAGRLSKLAGDVERQYASLSRISEDRFLWANTLNALQMVTIPQIEFISLEQTEDVFISQIQPTAEEVQESRRTGLPPFVRTTFTENRTLRIQAKNMGEAQHIDTLITNIQNNAYFKGVLKDDQDEMVRLIERNSPQADVTDISKSFILFTFECYFKEKVERNY